MAETIHHSNKYLIYFTFLFMWVAYIYFFIFFMYAAKFSGYEQKQLITAQDWDMIFLYNLILLVPGKSKTPMDFALRVRAALGAAKASFTFTQKQILQYFIGI